MPRKSDWTLEQQLLDGRTIDIVTKCWLWRQQGKSGYGKLTWHGRTIDVHRVSAHIYLGLDLDSALLSLHKCHNKHCFNPEHLYVGTQRDNIGDSVRDKTHYKARKTYCTKGHLYTEDNTYLYAHNGYRARYCRICMKAHNDVNNAKRKQNNEHRNFATI